MELVEIDMIRAKPPQAFIQVCKESSSVRRRRFCSDDNLVTGRCAYRLANQFFTVPISMGRVDEIDSEFEAILYQSCAILARNPLNRNATE